MTEINSNELCTIVMRREVKGITVYLSPRPDKKLRIFPSRSAAEMQILRYMAEFSEWLDRERQDAMDLYEFIQMTDEWEFSTDGVQFYGKVADNIVKAAKSLFTPKICSNLNFSKVKTGFFRFRKNTTRDSVRSALLHAINLKIERLDAFNIRNPFVIVPLDFAELDTEMIMTSMKVMNGRRPKGEKKEECVVINFPGFKEDDE